MRHDPRIPPGLEPGGILPEWERRLTRGAKLRRTLVIASALGLALAVLTASTGVLAAAWQHFRAVATDQALPTATRDSWITPPVLPAQSPEPLTMTSWQAIPAPEGGRSQISFTPLPDDPSSVFACAAARNIPGNGPLAGPVKLWRTTDSGEHWRPLPMPALTADTCILRFVFGEPGRILLLSHATAPSGACLSPTLLLSQNSGASWNVLKPPHATGYAPDRTTMTRCDAWAAGPYLYWYETDLCPTASGICQELLRSEDNGQSWQHTDAGLMNCFFEPVWTNADDGRTILAACLTAAAARASTKDTVLWVSNDAGVHWLRLRDFPHMANTLTYVSLEPASSGMNPWSIIYRELIGPTGTTLHNVVESFDGQTWATVPSLPVAGTDAHHDGIAEVVGIDAIGRLLVLGPNPRTVIEGGQSNQPSTAALPQWLWSWNPDTQRWASAPTGLPVVPEDSTVSWGNIPGSAISTNVGTWIWLTSPSASGTLLMRTFLPGNDGY